MKSDFSATKSTHSFYEPQRPIRAKPSISKKYFNCRIKLVTKSSPLGFSVSAFFIRTLLILASDHNPLKPTEQDTRHQIEIKLGWFLKCRVEKNYFEKQKKLVRLKHYCRKH